MVTNFSLLEEANKNSLVEKIKFGLTNKQVDVIFTPEELSKGMFAHCLIIALNQLSTEIKARGLIHENQREEKVQALDKIIALTKFAKRELFEEDEDVIDQLRDKFEHAKKEESSFIFDPEILLKLNDMLSQYFGLVDKGANDKNVVNTGVKNSDRAKIRPTPPGHIDKL